MSDTPSDETKPPLDRITDTKMERVFADIIASVVVLSLPLFLAVVLISYLGASIAAINALWFSLYALIVIMSATRLYGKGILKASKDALGKLGGK